MRYGLQDRTQRLETDSDIEQMSGKEEIIEVTKDREDEIPQRIQKGIVCYCYTGLPDLIAPVNVQNTETIQLLL